MNTRPLSPALLLVCTANICRSPMAEAVIKAQGLFAQVESAGLHAGPRGEPVDARALRALGKRGYELGRRWRSRPVALERLELFDLVLVMELEHLQWLRERAPAHLHERLQLFMDFVPGRRGEELPDPYYGSEQGFENVLDLVEQGAAGLRQALERGLLQPA
jgi:protein-tyrosine phosphatase